MCRRLLYLARVSVLLYCIIYCLVQERMTTYCTWPECRCCCTAKSDVSGKNGDVYVLCCWRGRRRVCDRKGGISKQERVNLGFLINKWQLYGIYSPKLKSLLTEKFSLAELFLPKCASINNQQRQIINKAMPIASNSFDFAWYMSRPSSLRERVIGRRRVIHMYTQLPLSWAYNRLLTLIRKNSHFIHFSSRSNRAFSIGWKKTKTVKYEIRRVDNLENESIASNY